MKRIVMTSLAVLAGACAAAPLSEADPAPFTPVQAEAFAVKGSLSNAWGDIDGDGDLDFAVSIKGGEVKLYENRDNTFVSVGTAWGLPTEGDEIRGLSWGDYDGDGDLDLLGGSNVSPYPSRSYVWRNEGGSFTEVAEEIGLTIPARWSRQSNWIDFDSDGDLDLYGANRSGINWLWRNEGGTFTQMGFRESPADPRRTVGACWFDMDSDGDLDLFLANQNGDSDAMWRNDGGSFTDVAPELGMDQTLRGLMDGGVGCTVGDYDNDGDFDLYVAAYGDNLLYRNDGENWTDVASEMGVTGQHSTVGAAFGDFDNDGLLDLFVVGYEHGEAGQVPMDILYRNTGTGFEPVSDPSVELNAGDHGVQWIDYDEDGDIDLSLTDGYGPEGGHPLFRNELSEEARARSLSVLVLDEDGLFTTPGAEVRVYDEDGELLASRMVTTGGGYNTQSALPVYFGLPSKAPVDVEVTFMSPDGPKVRRLEDVSTGKAITVRGLKGEVSG
ncbi:CRTAC1 family protein [Henriciella aquimarina]|uniref:CRTAC1 family protein n=1 Tax=Henriciella aquimarina TaxID=545261 RepID=UPI000A078F26|nr:CRTAC1 family protein [Henriciella aquimarina]